MRHKRCSINSTSAAGNLLSRADHTWPLRAFFTKDLRLQLHEVDEDISLPPQLIGDHWRPAFYRRHDGDANPATLQGFDQRTKIAIAGKQDDLIEVIGQLHRVDRKFNAYVALQLTAPLAIVKFFRWFCNNGEAVVVEPIDQRPQREELLILEDHGVIECAY